MGTKIKKIIIVSTAVFVLVITSILAAYAEYSQKLPISQSITLKLIIPPRAVLKVDEEKIDGKSVSINSKDLLNASSPSEKDHLVVDKVIKDGVEVTRVTKILYEGLYQDL